MKYQLNKAINHYGKNDPPSSVPPTTPTPTRMQHEDISANIDVSKLDMNKCVYGATDYGHVVLSQTVPLTNNDIRFHVYLYNKQQQHQQRQLQIIDNMQDTEKTEQDVVEKQQPDMKHDVSDEKSKLQDLQQQHEQFEEMYCNWVIHSSHEVDFISLTDDALKNDQLEKLRIMLDSEIKFMKTAFSVEDLKLPKPFSITNEQVHEESFARKFARRREKRKKRKKNKKVVLAEEQLKSCSFTGIIDPDELLRRQKVRLSVKYVLREFYYCPAAMNEHRHQYVASHNIYVKLARKEREYVKKSCAAKLQYHRKQLKVMMLIGLAGMGFNTFLKGRPRREGKSQICVFCFQPLSLLPATILKDGKEQKKHSHGALTCNNSNCPAVLAEYTTFNRDAVGATGIGLAAVTTVFSRDKKPLPPYYPSASTTTTATTTSNFELYQIYRLVSPSSTFLHGAGQTSM
ncbi:hypothetical protein BDA99DRAFT_498535 [Phascolomyces articulosus]|uniref:Uncharacterized protein n=1 Tax=Phascolomyces articulosus TaxID=60185 RepID=A0AAD5K9D1_9FUNG|nr:hypothetical protein BDA99DRAFT_498535 [Phascolomyces articulosus]